MSSTRPPEAPTEIESTLEKISSLQEKAARDFRPNLSGLKDRPRGVFPLLSPEEIGLDWQRLERLLKDVSAVVEGLCGRGASGASGVPHLHDDACATLLARALEGEGGLERLGGELGAEPATFAFAARCALAPFLEAYARRLEGEFDPESVLQGRCPVCGAEPFMAELDGEDGRRRLQCGLCRTQWRFPRLKCPFCGSDDQKALGFLEVEGVEGYRADTCDACGRYMKALDRRRVLRQLPLELADALSPELDEAAQERGYGLSPKAGTDRCGSGTG